MLQPDYIFSEGEKTRASFTFLRKETTEELVRPLAVGRANGKACTLFARVEAWWWWSF